MIVIPVPLEDQSINSINDDISRPFTCISYCEHTVSLSNSGLVGRNYHTCV